MFCKNCGAENADNAIFCGKCGAALNDNGSLGQENEMSQNNSSFVDSETVQSTQSDEKKNKIIGMAVVAAAAVVVVFILVSIITGIFGRSYKSTVKKLYKAFFNADGKAIVSLIPDKMVKQLCRDEDITKKEAIENVTEELEEAIEYYDYYYDDDWKYSYKILDAENYSKDDLKDIKEEYKDEFGIRVKAAKTVSVKLTITSDGEKTSRITSIDVIKVGNSWYITDIYPFN